MTIFQERIRKALKDKGWSQSELLTRVAQKNPGMVISNSSISMYLSGKRTPQSAVIRALANTLGISAAYLAGYTDSPHDNSIKDDDIRDLYDYMEIKELEMSEPQDSPKSNLQIDETNEPSVKNETIELLDYAKKMAQLPKEKRTLIYNMIDNLV